MFYTLHRSLKVIAYAMVLLVAWKIYERREIFEPLSIWYDVWDNGGFRVAEPRTMAGRAIHVVNSQTFVLATRARRFNVRLMGLKAPVADRSVEAMERERQRHEALEKLIKGNWVYLEIGYENLDSLGGVAFLGSTNVNAQLVLQAKASANKESVRDLPSDSQYALLWAQRRRTAVK
jgi:hypothetical protein